VPLVVNGSYVFIRLYDFTLIIVLLMFACPIKELDNKLIVFGKIVLCMNENLNKTCLSMKNTYTFIYKLTVRNYSCKYNKVEIKLRKEVNDRNTYTVTHIR